MLVLLPVLVLVLVPAVVLVLVLILVMFYSSVSSLNSGSDSGSSSGPISCSGFISFRLSVSPSAFTTKKVDCSYKSPNVLFRGKV